MYGERDMITTLKIYIERQRQRQRYVDADDMYTYLPRRLGHGYHLLFLCACIGVISWISYIDITISIPCTNRPTTADISCAKRFRP